MDRNQLKRNVLFLPFAFQAQFHFGIARYASNHGWHLNADMVRTGRIPYGWKGDGIITILNEDRMALRMALQYGVPLVDMAMIQPEAPLARVSKDNFAIGQMGARHFLEQGWHHFAFFSREYHNTCRLRLAGFRQELQRHGLPCQELILQPLDPIKSEDWDAVRQWLVQRLKSLDKPLAVMAYNDYEAAVVMDACLAGELKIPEDVGILGVDDEVICLCQRVPISSVLSEADTVGYRAAELLDLLMDGGRMPESPILIPPAGVAHRQSTNRLVIRNRHLAKAIEIMEQQLDRPLSMETVADDAGITRLALYRSISAATDFACGRPVRQKSMGGS